MSGGLPHEKRRPFGVLRRRLGRARRARRWRERLAWMDFGQTEQRLFELLLALMIDMHEQRHAVDRQASVDRKRIQDELVPQMMSAAQAWFDEGAPLGSEKHIAYARAQSWLAWACWERAQRAWRGLASSHHTFQSTWIDALVAEGFDVRAPTRST
jgi:hypothetical protein